MDCFLECNKNYILLTRSILAVAVTIVLHLSHQGIGNRTISGLKFQFAILS